MIRAFVFWAVVFEYFWKDDGAWVARAAGLTK
jgi:hypothetical protein